MEALTPDARHQKVAVDVRTMGPRAMVPALGAMLSPPPVSRRGVRAKSLGCLISCGTTDAARALIIQHPNCERCVERMRFYSRSRLGAECVARLLSPRRVDFLSAGSLVGARWRRYGTRARVRSSNSLTAYMKDTPPCTLLL
ncbi:unnamed protein product, partial [Iphiclides podalirius]